MSYVKFVLCPYIYYYINILSAFKYYTYTIKGFVYEYNILCCVVIVVILCPISINYNNIYLLLYTMDNECVLL